MMRHIYLVVTLLLSMLANTMQADTLTLPRDQRPQWLSRDGIVMAGSWEPLMFRVRRDGSKGYTPTPEQQAAYDREHSPEMIARLKDLGVNFVMMHCHKGAGMEAERQSMADAVEFARQLHGAGLHVGTYVGSSTLLRDFFFKEVPQARDWIIRRPDGSPRSYLVAEYRSAWNRSHPQCQSYLKRVTNFAIEEVKTDLVHFDNHFYGPGHDAYSKESFRAYLKKTFTAEELRDMVAADLEKVQPPTSGPPDNLLRRAWLDFSCQSLADSYHELGHYTRSLRKDVLVECNPYGTLARITPPIDRGRLLSGGEAFWDEATKHAGMHDGQLQTAIRTYKVARLMDNMVFRYVRSPLDAAESMAFNQNCLGCICWFEYGNIIDYPIVSLAKPMDKRTGSFVSFFHARRDLLRDTKVVADVAVLRSFPSQVFAPPEHAKLTNEIEQTLIENRACFQIVFDHNLADLKRYKALILAGCVAMSDEQVDQIKRYVAHGGRLCVIGPLATHDKWMLPREKAALDDLPADRVIRIENSEHLLDAVGRALDERPSLRISSKTKQQEPPLGLCVELTSQDKRRLVHLVNYRHDDPVEEIVVEVQIPDSRKVTSVVLARPGREHDIEVPHVQEDGYVKFAVPSVDIYEVAVVSME